MVSSIHYGGHLLLYRFLPGQRHARGRQSDRRANHRCTRALHPGKTHRQRRVGVVNKIAPDIYTTLWG